MKLIITQANGFVAVFTENGDGVKQRALIDIGTDEQTPQQLADFAQTFAEQYGWTGIRAQLSSGDERRKQHDRERKAEKRALAKGITLPDDAQRKKRPATRNKYPNEPKGQARTDAILAFVRENPDTTIRDIYEAITGKVSDHHAESRWYHPLRELVAAGLLTRRQETMSNKGGGPGGKTSQIRFSATSDALPTTNDESSVIDEPQPIGEQQ